MSTNLTLMKLAAMTVNSMTRTVMIMIMMTFLKFFVIRVSCSEVIT